MKQAFAEKDSVAPPAGFVARLNHRPLVRDATAVSTSGLDAVIRKIRVTPSIQSRFQVEPVPEILSTQPKLFCFVLMPFDAAFEDVYQLGINQ